MLLAYTAIRIATALIRRSCHTESIQGGIIIKYVNFGIGYLWLALELFEVWEKGALSICFFCWSSFEVIILLWNFGRLIAWRAKCAEQRAKISLRTTANHVDIGNVVFWVTNRSSRVSLKENRKGNISTRQAWHSILYILPLL